MRALALLLTVLAALPCGADVVVIANRTRQEVTARFTPTQGRPYTLRLATAQVTPLFSDSPLQISYSTGAGMTGFRLRANSAYYFGDGPNGPEMHQIGLSDKEDSSHARPLPGGGATTPAGVLNVKVYVDEEEAAQDEIWRRKIEARVRRASEILLAHSGVSLRVTGAGRWQSDNATHDFGKSLREFEKEAQTPPGGIAIGFSSQYQVARGRTHMGGTHGPLSSHILLREWSHTASEHERLELLVHELGHFLGATHSPEPDSVMRPVIGGSVSKLKEFNIRFDPVNTLIMSMVGEEVRRRGVKQFKDLTPETLKRLNQVYGTVAKAMPGDQSASQFVARTLQGKSIERATLVKRIVAAITRAATHNQSLPEHQRLTGDDLTESLVRNAAAEAIGFRDRGSDALLLGLAIAFDDTAMLKSTPGLGNLVRQADPPMAMRERARVLGKPTMWGRADLAKHFFLSAGLTAALDAPRAEALGLAKETLDSHRASGFSFADLAADRAGVRFAQSVQSGRLPPVNLTDNFAVVRFMPTVENLPEGLTAAEFTEQFGSPSDPRFRELIDEIDGSIQLLTGFHQP